MNRNIQTRIANIEVQLNQQQEQAADPRQVQKPPFDYEGFRYLSEQFFLSLPEGAQRESN